MDRLREYKKSRNPFTSEAARFKRAEQTELRRRQQRDKHVAQRREIIIDEKLDDTLTDEEPKDILSKLKKWKEEKALKKKLNAKNKKPVFKIGIPHHNFYSPTSKDDKPHCHHKRNKDVINTEPKKISKATERRLALKAAAAAASAASAASTESGKTPIARCTRSRKKAAAAAEAIAVSLKSESIAPKNYEFKNPIADSMPLFGRFNIPMEPDTPKEQTNKYQFTFELNTSNDKKNLDDTPKDKTKEQEISPQITDENDELKISDDDPVIEQSETNDTSIESITLRVSSQESLDSNEGEKIINKHLNIQDKCSSPVAAQFSPFVTTSRGKSSARKEFKKRMSLRTSCSPADDIPTKDTVMKNLNISIDEEEHTAQYYRSLGEREANRLRELCLNWRKIQHLSDTPEESIHHINSAIGQAELLLNKKFGRFQQLVDNCEDGKGEMLVRCRDLQGFWELVARETADCDSRFCKLEKLKDNNWTEEEEEQQQVHKVIQKKPVNKKKNVVKKKQNTAKSQMKLFIEEQRKKKLQEQSDNVNVENNENIIDDKIQPFSTPRKSLLSSEPFISASPKSLVRHQLTDSAKKMALASMKITQIYKTPELKLDKSISYVNSHQTPGKGILKKLQFELPVSEKRNTTKSTFKVNFNDTIDEKELPSDDDELPVELPVVNIDKNVTVVLEKIDPVNISPIENENETDNEKVISLDKKKLTFDDSLNCELDEKLSDENEKSKDNVNSSIPSITLTSPTPIKQRINPVINIINSTPNKKQQKKRNKKCDSIDVIETPRQLRSRSIKIDENENIKSIKSCDTSQMDLSTKDITDKENIANKKKNIKKISDEDNNNISLNMPSTPRKSTRLSTKNTTTDDTCNACSIILPSTPMTPRRRKKIEKTE
ncbi:disks large-associated protein 5-like [Aphidius gifuensis]|uniref:disks large-associated protein 5-like n=1 Tax=Aphidius gifuensis TaxID=684658 RepID=UPI001CDC1481|nr:disks large-associated protein 5-like [Aphidius gifuensis]